MASPSFSYLLTYLEARDFSRVRLHEKWIREHLPDDCKDEPINWFSGLYINGLKVMSEGERGNPDKIRYEAKDEEDLKWWQLDIICSFVGKADNVIRVVD